MEKEENTIGNDALRIHGFMDVPQSLGQLAIRIRQVPLVSKARNKIMCRQWTLPTVRLGEPWSMVGYRIAERGQTSSFSSRFLAKPFLTFLKNKKQSEMFPLIISAWICSQFKILFFFFFFSGKYYFYDNYFDLPGALLCARVVDLLTKVKTFFLF